jgi:GTP-binding protein
LKQIDCQFKGSYFTVEQLPKDNMPQIAFAGRSNVGKSTLLNKLLGKKKLAKVSSTPGKTRSVNFFEVNNKFNLVDLPGYGYAKGPKAERDSWGKLIETYLETSRNLIGLMILLDCRREPNAADEQLIEWLIEKDLPRIAIITKADKLNKDKIKRKVREIEKKYNITAIPFSALSGTGKNEILKAITDLVNENSNLK